MRLLVDGNAPVFMTKFEFFLWKDSSCCPAKLVLLQINISYKLQSHIAQQFYINSLNTTMCFPIYIIESFPYFCNYKTVVSRPNINILPPKYRMSTIFESLVMSIKIQGLDKK
jgi:hypothetical protein